MSFSNVLMGISNFANEQCRFYCLVFAICLMGCCEFNANRQTCCMTCCITCYITCLNGLLRALHTDEIESLLVKNK